MDSLPPDQHHPFVDLDVHSDAEEALEAIRVAIGQSSDFDTDALGDVSVDHHHHHPQQQQQQHQQHDAGNAIAGGSGSNNHAVTVTGPNDSSSIDPPLAKPGADDSIPTLISATQVHNSTIEKGLKAIIDLGFSNEVLLDSIKNPEHVETVKTIVEDVKKKSEIAKSLLAQVQNHNITDLPAALSNIDPLLQAQYVSKADYDALKSRLDALTGDSGEAASQATQPKSRKRTARPSATVGAVAAPESREETREGNGSAPPDEKGRKKRSMKLEHLVHQMANRRLGIEYNVSGFESKGGRELPAPDTAPTPATESANGVQEFRPDFTSDITAATVKPFLEQVMLDCLKAWENGVGKDEQSVTPKKVKESVDVYWLRLGKRWDEQATRALGGVHKDELVRRKQNQYRRQQSLVARRQASFDQSPLNVCKLRSYYRTLLTIDFAAKTDERPSSARSYTEAEWYAYRLAQYGSRAQDAHEVMDIFWLSPFVRAALCILDVFSTDQNARIKRKGKPKTPAPGFHLPRHLWDTSSLPTLRPKKEDGLPIAGAQGIVLFRFHVDPRIIAANPQWAQGLYDDPPIPETDTLLPHLTQVMNATVYQHLQPLVKLMRDSGTVTRMTEEQVQETLDRPPTMTEDPGTIGPMIEAFYSAQPNTDMANANLDLSLETLVSMTQNSYMNTNPLANQLAVAAMETDNENGVEGGRLSRPRIWPGSSQQARKMGKRTASDAPDGAVEPVPKRAKGEVYALPPGHEAPGQYLSEDTDFVNGL